MKYKLIASDLDGTLLNDAKQISPRTEAALKAAAEKGVVIVPATGRSLLGVPDMIKNYPYVDYVMTSNGALAYNLKEKKNLYVEPLAHEIIFKVMDLLEPYGAMWHLFAEKTVYYEYHGKQPGRGLPPDLQGNPYLPAPLQPDMRTYLENHPEFTVEKIDVYFNEPSERWKVWNIVETWDNVSIAAAFDYNMEVNAKQGDKGNGLIRLGRELGIKPEEMIAFGDGLNDILLLKAAGMPVAVANAVPELKTVAKEITLSNDEDGVAIAIEKYVLNEEN